LLLLLRRHLVVFPIVLTSGLALEKTHENGFWKLQ
ncbi:hypothetical protein T07_14799, partial [Trichinella nelsoni]